MPRKLGPAVIGFALTAALSLSVAAAAVSMIGANEPDTRTLTAVPAAQRTIALDVQDYTDAMRRQALTAPTAKGPNRATATELIELTSKTVLADLAPVRPGTIAPERDALIAAVEEFRRVCLTELGRTHARGTDAPTVPPALAAAESRLIIAAEAADQAATLAEQRKADERNQVFGDAQQSTQRLAIIAVIVFTILGLLSATAAGIAFRLRRATADAS
ncbi:hypothetical protein [Actinoplanes sp. NPDC051859]|uniref:hypothetical protein n=1 Tax=Actinoplanes sp. NPDC051859 TaxID=3363909 RepID=UPI00379B6339